MIKDFNEIQHLIQLPCLTSLFLSSNPIDTSNRNDYRLKIFFFYIKYGKIFNGFYSLPFLDNKKISKTEKKKLKKIIYSRTIDTCKELTLDREDLDFFNIDEFYDEDLSSSNYNSESEDEMSISGAPHGIRVSFNNNSYRTRSYSGVNNNSLGGSAPTTRSSTYGTNSWDESSRKLSVAPSSPAPSPSIIGRTSSQGSLSPYSNRHSSVDRRSIAPISKNDFLRMRLSTTNPSSSSNLNSRGSIIGRNSIIMKKFSLKQSNRVKRNALILENKQDIKNSDELNKDFYDENEINEFFSVIENDIKYNGMLWQKFVDPLPLIYIENKEKDTREKEKEFRERGLSSASNSSLPLSSSSELEGTIELSTSDPNSTTNIIHPSLEVLNSTDSGVGNLGGTSLRNSFLHNLSAVNVTGLGNNFIDKDLPSPRPSISVNSSLSRKNSTAINSFSAAAAAAAAGPSVTSSLTSSYDVVNSPISPKNKSISTFSFGSTSTPSLNASKLASDPSAAFVSEADPYVGDAQYKDLNVLENLEVYLREQVFSIKRPSFPNLFLKNKLTQKINSAELAGPPSSSFSSTSSNAPPNNDYSLKLIAPYSSSERFIALYIEKVIDVKEIIKEKKRRKGTLIEDDDENDDGTVREGGGDIEGDKDEGRVSLQNNNYVEDEETDTEETEEEEDTIYEKKVAIVLTDIGFYILDLMDISSTFVFKDTPLLSVLRQHPLYKLNLCTIYFGFQRCLLGFLKDPYRGGQNTLNSSSSTSTYLNPLTNSSAYTAIYMVVTRDKSHMYPIITRIPQVANQRRNNLKPISLRNVIINNNDNELLDGLMRFNNNNDRDIIYYQMVFYLKKKKKRTINNQNNLKEIQTDTNNTNLSTSTASSSTLPEYKTTRSILITKFFIFLCYENLYKKKIKLKLIDSSNLKDIEKVFIDENNPMYITIQFKRLNMFGSKRKWRLCTEGRNPCDKLLEEVKRACYEVGNQLP